MEQITYLPWYMFMSGDLGDHNFTGLHYLVRAELVKAINDLLEKEGFDLRVFAFDYFDGEYKALRAYRNPGTLAIEDLVEEEVNGLQVNEIEMVEEVLAKTHHQIDFVIERAYAGVISSAAEKLSRIWMAMAEEPEWNPDTLVKIGEILEHVVSPDEPSIPGLGSEEEVEEEEDEETED